MLGFIKKDLLMVKGNLKTLAIIFVVFAIMSINGNGDFTFIPAFLSVMIMMSSFSYDEYNKTNAFMIALPNGNKNAVKSKYLATLLIALISILLTFIISIIAGYIQKSINIEDIFSALLGCFVGITIIQSIIYPFIFKYGVEKSRIGIFVGIFGMSGILSLLLKSGIHIKIPQSIVNFFTTYGIIILVLVTILILYISYRISESIYLKKEF